MNPSDIHTVEELLANCAREDLAHIGSIQPFSFVLEISKPDFKVIACSENLNELTGRSHEEAIDKSLTELFGDLIDAEKLALVQHAEAQISVPNAFTINQKLYHLSLHNLGPSILIEIEKSGQIRLSETERQGLVHRPLQLSDSSSVVAIIDEFADRFANITGFDRILVYQFMEDWSGKVVSEKGTFYEPSMLGLHFPASDIPPNARKLYESVPSRIIADTRAEAVAIFRATKNPMNQSRCRSRSCSKAHLMYLENMGVRSSFSVSIMFKNQLWGLIACHHHEPFLPDLRVRLDCERLSRALAVELMRVHAERKMQMIENFKFGASNLLEQLPPRLQTARDFNPIAKGLMDLLDADGFAVVQRNDILTTGHCPSESELLILQELVGSKTENRYFKIESLASIYPASLNWLPKVSGMLAIGTAPLSKASQSDFVFFWFRSEYTASIDWAGKNAKGTESIRLSDGTPVLSPRSSFELWTEEKKQNCRPWTSEQVFKANLWVHNLSKKFNQAIDIDSDLELHDSLPFR